MDFSIPEEMKLVLSTVRRFVHDRLLPLEDEVERADALSPDIASDLRREARELGLFALHFPEDIGGGGLNVLQTCLCEEEFGYAKDVLIRRAFGQIPASLENCVGEQRQRYLLPAVAGEINIGAALTEPEAGSDAAGIKTRARRDGDDFILSGTKHFISDADFADTFIVTAVTDPDLGSNGITSFLVDRTEPGFSNGRMQPMMGLRGAHCGELVFDDIRLPKAAILGEEGRGLFQALSTIGKVRLTKVGARSVGMARRLLELSLGHASTRKQFGRPLGEFQMVKAMLADMATELAAVRLMVLETAWQVDGGADPRARVSMVKLASSEMLGRVADRAVQVFGGTGYCVGHPVERLYRDARVYRIFDGASDIQRLVVAKGLMENGVSEVLAV